MGGGVLIAKSIAIPGDTQKTRCLFHIDCKFRMRKQEEIFLVSKIGMLRK